MLISRLIAIALLSVGTGEAAYSALPPLIDRELLFGDPEIAGAQISQDGRFIALLKPFSGTRNIWVKRTVEPFGKARPLTAETRRPIPQYSWSRNGKYILFLQDNGGDENLNVFAAQPDAALAAGRQVPDARNITAAQGERFQGEMKPAVAEPLKTITVDPKTVAVKIPSAVGAEHAP